MEHFAIKIDKKLRANLYKICRLCGIDKPDMSRILPEDEEKNEQDPIEIDVDTQLSQKIYELTGLLVTKDDEMPQSMCSFCIDKITDFYEFREMCLATNAQTRKLLGLKSVQILKNTVEMDIKPSVWISPEVSSFNRNKNRKRKSSEDVTIKQETLLPFSRNLTNKKLRLPTELLKETAMKRTKKREFHNSLYYTTDVKDKIKDEIKHEYYANNNAIYITGDSRTIVSSLTKLKKQICTICNEPFATKAKLQAHLRHCHVPKVERFVCIACNEILHKNFDIKNHQLWHKLSKTPYKCALCNAKMHNIYAYARHCRRDHNYVTPSCLLTYDRVCPKCQVPYPTHFLYNIHACAMQTKRCAGCNRMQRSEMEYLKHSAQCAKAYLTYTQHIVTGVTPLEDGVQIKNENDVEAAAEEFCKSSGLSFDMNPVVCLTRLSMSEDDLDTGKTIAMEDGAKKSNKNRLSKKDYKRVDELLKSTLDTLVSIKQEPEINVGLEGSTTYFLANSNSNQDNGDGTALSVNLCNTNAENNNLDKPEQMIKKEVEDMAINTATDYDNGESCSNKIPVLKLKIKKEHGQLNSSLLIDQDIGEYFEKRKKKKKHKDKPRANEMSSAVATDMDLSINQEMNVRIKTEPLDNELIDSNGVMDKMQPSATIMTSIPMMQLQISEVSEAVDFTNNINSNIKQIETIEESEDIKPNRIELDNLMKITQVSGGVEMPLSAESIDKSAAAAAAMPIVKSVHQKASKSTAGRHLTKCLDTDSALSLQIATVEGGISMVNLNNDPSIFVKPEPLNRGYADEVSHYTPPENDAITLNANIMDGLMESDHKTNDNEMASCNVAQNVLCNMRIKEEQDLDISDVQWKQLDNGYPTDELAPVNGEHLDLHKNSNNDSDRDSASSDDDDRDDEDENELLDMQNVNEEEREYRELELPPELQNYTATNEELPQSQHGHHQLLDNRSDNNCEVITANDSAKIIENHHQQQHHQQVLFKISNVCTQEEDKLPIINGHPSVQQFPENTHDADNSETTRENFKYTDDLKDQTNGLLNGTTSEGLNVNELSTRDTPNSSLAKSVSKCDDDHDHNHDSKNCLTTSHSSVHDEVIYQTKEEDLQARPYFNTESNLTGSSNHMAAEIATTTITMPNNFNTEEEQQNQQNQDLIQQQQQQQQQPQPLLQQQQQQQQLPDNCDSFAMSHSFLADITVSSDHLLNDHHQHHHHHHHQVQHQQQPQPEPGSNRSYDIHAFNSINRSSMLPPPFVPLFNFDNINEIAENNNNANIERELQVGEQLRQRPYNDDIHNAHNNGHNDETNDNNNDDHIT